MKIISFISLLLALCACTTAVGTNDAKISFPKTVHDFGSLDYKKEASYNFQFTNPGENPLVVLDVKTSCGCTIADWTKKPIKPGKSGKILVTYDAGFPGMFHKEISVFYNGVDSPAKLEIKGEVKYPDDMQTKE